MANITVIGGTGYAGRHITAAASRRGHTVTVLTRTAPSAPLDGVSYLQGDVFDDVVLAQAFHGADVVIAALSPRGELTGRMLAAVTALERLSASTHTRLGVVGGAGSLFVAPGGPTLSGTEEFPDEFKAEAAEMHVVLDYLRGENIDADWFYISPPAGFGDFAVGEYTGTWRVGDEILLVDEDGQSTISGADFGEVFITEIETPEHHNQRFTVAY
ncbi:NAD(P)-dependent oxidoreductase [Subtercola endophyticus]|uniref:NAD(P)-dependent oxidoreductase n=1 Tax=Subtercola endophyticus TaxID=2895559 RepID=UPI001E644664|nr:NAD(P)H-binding protein [Subtercola endophyticus]UFS60587.1 NAD(P)H-binding protein [Subtercola endophyticus]